MAADIAALGGEAMSRHQSPGLSIAVMRDGREVYAAGFGQRDLATGAPMTPDTLFGVASISKSVTALTVARLAERGQRGLDEPVQHFLDLRLGVGDEPIRVWHLLSRSSGIPELFGENAVLFALAEGRVPPIALDSWDALRDFVNRAAGLELAPPGQLYAYSNDAFSLLGAIVEARTGREFPRRMRAQPYAALRCSRGLASGAVSLWRAACCRRAGKRGE